jgi:hypothetical protein
VVLCLSDLVLKFFRCDDTDINGEKKPRTELRSSYSYAMKMRASMTYAFGRNSRRGINAWGVTDDGKSYGNPSISSTVSRYMVSLRRRKVPHVVANLV